MQRREPVVSPASTHRLREPVEQDPQYVAGGGLVQGAVDRVAAGGVRRQARRATGVQQGVDDGRAAGPDAVEERRLAGGGVGGERVEPERGGVVEEIDGGGAVAGAGGLHQQRPTADVDRRSDAERQRVLQHLQVAALDAAPSHTHTQHTVAYVTGTDLSLSADIQLVSEHGRRHL